MYLTSTHLVYINILVPHFPIASVFTSHSNILIFILVTFMSTPELLPTPAETRTAISQLARALSSFNVHFGIIGGGAVAILSNAYGEEPRMTEDIDLIVQPTTLVFAESVCREYLELNSYPCSENETIG